MCVEREVLSVYFELGAFINSVEVAVSAFRISVYINSVEDGGKAGRWRIPEELYVVVAVEIRDVLKFYGLSVVANMVFEVFLVV